LMLLRKRKVRSLVNVDIVSSSSREQEQWEFPDR